MKNEAVRIFQKKRKQILENWMKLQLSDESLREDLIGSEELRGQSEEPLNVFVDCLRDDNLIILKIPPLSLQAPAPELVCVFVKRLSSWMGEVSLHTRGRTSTQFLK